MNDAEELLSPFRHAGEGRNPGSCRLYGFRPSPIAVNLKEFLEAMRAAGATTVIPAIFKPESMHSEPRNWRGSGFRLKTCRNDEVAPLNSLMS
jgi:hypothetical protein